MADPDLSILIHELANRGDATPICSQTLGIGGNAPALSATFNVATTALRIFFSEALQRYVGSITYIMGPLTLDRPDASLAHQVQSTGVVSVGPTYSGVDSSGMLTIGKPNLLDVVQGAGHRILVLR